MSEEQQALPMDNVPSVDYVRLNGRVYSITPIANEEVDLEAEMKAYFNEKYLRHISEFNNGIVSGLTDDWDGQLQRLRDHNTRTDVVIPAQLHHKPVVTIDGREVEEIRAVIYSPHVFKMVACDVATYLNVPREERRTDAGSRFYHYQAPAVIRGGVEVDLNQYAGDDKLLVHVKRRIFFPALYSYNSRNNRLSCFNVRTFHNQGTRICTGAHKASDFWSAPNFEERMNEVNCFSLGSSTVRLMSGGGAEYRVNEYVTSETVTSIVREGGEGTWRA